MRRDAMVATVIAVIVFAVLSLTSSCRREARMTCEDARSDLATAEALWTDQNAANDLARQFTLFDRLNAAQRVVESC